MLGLDPDLVMHHMIVTPGTKMYPQVALLIKVELEKFLDVGFIKLIDYPVWISNLVPVSKPNNNIRICTNFIDINKACSKDDFPLPNIDLIVNITTDYAMLSVMDGFSRYN